MLKERSCTCAFWIKESVGMGNEEELNTRHIDCISDETL